MNKPTQKARRDKRKELLRAGRALFGVGLIRWLGQFSLQEKVTFSIDA
jgi:hypothetical protein